MKRLRVSVLATHPIQYHAPWFRALAAHEQVDLQVLFEYLPDSLTQGEGFGLPFQWDLDLLEGFEHQVLSGDGRRRRGRSLLALTRHFAVARPQVTLLTGWHSFVLLAAPSIAHSFGSRCIVRGDSNAIRPRSLWVRAGHRVLLRRYERFLAVGAANDSFLRVNGVAAHRIIRCPHLVDNDYFANAADSTLDAQRLREQFRIPGDATCFLFVGKLEAKKRVGDFIDAIRQLRGERVHALIVGSGALEEELRSRAQDLPVSFAGFINQSKLPAFYQASDCLVLPSDFGETWGLVVNEAMACARPAIVSDQVGCAEDLVLVGDTGWCFPVGDVRALAGAMREAMADSAQLVDMGVRAQAHVSEHFSVSRARDATLRAVFEVAGLESSG